MGARGVGQAYELSAGPKFVLACVGFDPIFQHESENLHLRSKR
jgi:hypothetical protein